MDSNRERSVSIKRKNVGSKIDIWAVIGESVGNNRDRNMGTKREKHEQL